MAFLFVMENKKKKTYRPDHDGPERGIYSHNKAILRKTATICALCGMPLDKSLKYPHPMSTSIDHIIPVALGGKSTMDNLQATHLVCNKEKGTKLLCMPAATTGKGKNNEEGLSNSSVKKKSSEIPQYIDWSNYSCEEG